MQSKQPKHAKISTLFIYSASFTVGFVILSLEILGFRIFAPYFGSSVYVSGSLISMVLIALSGGYYFGGKLADRHPDLDFLFRWIISAACYLSVITFFYKKILGFFAISPPIAGAILSTVFIFAFPMMMLSMVSPFLVKILLYREEKSNPANKNGNIHKAGAIVGIISATSTIGSILGSLATTFILIPWLGSKIPFSCVIFLLVIIALLYYIFQKNKYQLILIVPVIFLCSIAFSKEKSVAIFEKESIYNFIKVTQKEVIIFLQLNGDENIQSIYNPNKVFTKTYYDMFNIGPVVAGGNNVLILGLGGGTSANQLSLLFQAHVEGVEIDPDVVTAAEKYFSIKTINPDIKVHVMDGRAFLNTTKNKYDVIEIDMFHGGMYMPFHIATVEFFQMVREHLNDKGVMVINVLSFNEVKGGDELYYYLSNTMTKAFNSVFAIKQRQYNITVVAAKDTISLDDVREHIRQHPMINNAGIGEILQYALENIFIYKYNESYGFFTDDKAPIEQVTYNMLRKSH